MIFRKRYKLKVTLLIIVALLLFPYTGQADELEERSVTLTNPVAGEVGDQLFAFRFQSTNTVGSIAFEYCSNTAVVDAVCVAPSGLDVSSTGLVFQAGETGFSVHGNTTSNRLVIARPSSAVSPGPSQYLFSDITNQSTTNQTAYVRILAYTSSDGTGSFVDASSVAYSTSQRIETTAYVPPHLIFCVGITVALDCSSGNGNFIDVGELEPSLTAAATSQYSGATNDPTGYSVSIIGTTMTSGNNIIPALASQSSSNTGTGQFGINLRDNSSPEVGIDPIGPGSATVNPSYNTVNQFMFDSGDILSQTNRTTEFDRFTVAYIINVPPTQPAGIYSTTLSYIATASF